ncbi:MAG TPA: ABC transporter ATP-binding protein [Vicinamibacteria bacterium]|nr:ABC transporter ATP-binding protein [Vicinamibacteria bacterium]
MRGAVRIENVRKTYGAVTALERVSLEVQPGEFLTLLGPSGCGKTTLLRLIAGFEAPDEGRILISGRDVSALPPYERPVNTVFQHYALFPHRTVAGNVAFGLEARGLSRRDVEAKVSRVLETVRLTDLGGRGVDQLSGGQRQRVALARALVLEPEVLLLDEPMAALDVKLRQQMQLEVKNLQERLQTTFLFVTHDQDEALVMSDRIAVVNQGRLEQVDTTEALYERPRSRFTADFLGVRNILEVAVESVEGGRVLLLLGETHRFLANDDGGFRPGSRAIVGLRPERLWLEGERNENLLAGTLEDEIYLGDRTEWQVRVGPELLRVAESAGQGRERRRGEPVVVRFRPEAVLRLDP